jgi:chloride channel protein, CIC family
MAALFSAIVRAPLTGIVLIIEMTGNYDQLLALLVACLLAYLVAEHLREKPVYEALMERDLRRPVATHGSAAEPAMIDVVVEAGSPMAGKRVQDLGLPAGSLLVTIKRAGRHMVPAGGTRLREGDEVTLITSGDPAAVLPDIYNAARSRD